MQAPAVISDEKGGQQWKRSSDLPQVRHFCIVGLVLDAVDGAWYDYDDPNQVTLPLTVAARTNPATIEPSANVGVETESQASDIAPKLSRCAT